MRSEDLEVTLAFSYIREFMLSSVEKLLEKVDNWCCVHGVNVEIVVNDWAMVEILRGKTSHLSPVFGTLINKRKKDPRMKYNPGDTALFQHNSLNATGIFWRKNFISTDMNGNPAVIHRSFHQGKTAFICLFIRRIHPSIVRCTPCAPQEIVVCSSLRNTVRNSVKNIRCFTRNIYT